MNILVVSSINDIASCQAHIKALRLGLKTLQRHLRHTPQNRDIMNSTNSVVAHVAQTPPWILVLYSNKARHMSSKHTVEGSIEQSENPSLSYAT